MEILNTFVKGLYSVKYEGESNHELGRLLEEWNDIENLEEFFEANKADLVYYDLEPEDAVLETQSEASALSYDLVELSEEENIGLDALFVNLDNNQYKETELTKKKARRRWLRLYAIKIDDNCYLITGGTIKLTLQMEERVHTKLELAKLEKCKSYLEENGIFDLESFKEYLSE